ncbi:MAG: acyl-ACP--UDP-N-acetylglucosamine O-acyltransferase [Planctomycetota bacterium]|nr:acyl-ACP--UDP-N-acetylglucosamine O-acyltransferase [Planctomycetota bacterium]
MTGPAAVNVHPTAVVSPEADLGASVAVGPYAVIEAGAVVGASTTIDAHVVVKASATIGEDCRLHVGAVIGDDPQDVSFDLGAPTRVEIGDRTVLREYVTVHRSTAPERPTRIGSDCLLMGSSHVAHDCLVGDHVVLCNAALVAGHVEVGPRAFISGNAVVHQFCRVGAVVMLSGLSGISRDVGPYLTVSGRSDVSGLNVIGMRRAGLSGATRARVKEAYRRLFASTLLADGLVGVRELGLEHDEIREIAAFYAASQRGYSRPPQGHPLGTAER